MAAETFESDSGGYAPVPPRPTGLLDVLSVAAVVVDAEGRVVFWTPQAEELFGYTADEALGTPAARLFIHPDHLPAVVQLFTEVLETGRSWAGTFPVRHKDGSTRLTEFRNMRLLDDLGDVDEGDGGAQHPPAGILQPVEGQRPGVLVLGVGRRAAHVVLVEQRGAGGEHLAQAGHDRVDVGQGQRLHQPAAHMVLRGRAVDPLERRVDQQEPQLRVDQGDTDR